MNILIVDISYTLYGKSQSFGIWNLSYREAKEVPRGHGHRMKFRALDPKSKAGPSLWNKYVFYYEVKNLVTLHIFF